LLISVLTAVSIHSLELCRDWHQTDYMTACHSLSARVSADSSVDLAAMQDLFRTSPEVTGWGDMSVEVAVLKHSVLRGIT
jgi:hypothetical protein